MKKALSGLAGLLHKAVADVNRLMPAAEHTSEPIPLIKDVLTRRHRWIAAITAGLVYLSMLALVARGGASWFFYNPITTVGAILDRLTGSVWPGLIAVHLVMILVFAFLFYLFGRKPDATAKAAGHRDNMERFVLREEQIYREGAEHWTWLQRIRACLLFGLVHLLNLIVPYVAVVLLSIGGAVFMHEYLRVMRRTNSRPTALASSAALHHTYNLSIFYGMPFYLIGHVALAIVERMTK